MITTKPHNPACVGCSPGPAAMARTCLHCLPAFCSWTLPHACLPVTVSTRYARHFQCYARSRMASLQPQSRAKNTPAAQAARWLFAICHKCTQEPPLTPFHPKTHQHEYAAPVSGGGSQIPASAACSCWCCWCLVHPCGHPACLLSWWEPGLQGCLTGWQRRV